MSQEKTYERLVTEAKVPYWEEQGLLDGIEDEHVKLTTAVMLSNQKLFNAQTDDPVPNSLDIVAEAFPKLLAHKLVSVQPKLGPIGPVFYQEFRYRDSEEKESYPVDGHHDKEIEREQKWEVKERDVAVKARKLKFYKDENIRDPITAVNGLITGIDEEIIDDLWSNAGTVAAWDATVSPYCNLNKTEEFRVKLCQLMDVIHRKTQVNTRRYWVVASDTEIKKHKEIKQCLVNCKYAIDLHVVPGLPKKGLLIGVQGDKTKYYDSGYVYSPYVMIANTPNVGYEGFCSRRGYMTRYGKTLTNPKYYARMSII